jgi:hypothetical protein
MKIACADADSMTTVEEHLGDGAKSARGPRNENGQRHVMSLL